VVLAVLTAKATFQPLNLKLMKFKFIPVFLVLKKQASCWLLFLVFFVWGPLSMESAYAQSHAITGKVTSAEEGEPLPGVNVREKGSSNGAITDLDGNYRISVSEEAVLVFSSVGYNPEEVPVGNKSVINVKMEPDVRQLKEMVVVGYGSVEKSDLTGSVTSLEAESLTPGVNASVEQMLQGRAAGVQISQNSGEPGGAMAIKIRGANSISAGNQPLYVIDGLPVSNSAVIRGTGAGFVGNNNPRNPLASINPNDIESIEILKDASATAIYGSRGANGVILITTKKGSEGGLKVNLDSYYGLQTVANKLNLLNAEEYQTTLNAIIEDGGGNAGERVGEIQGNGTDWQDQLYRNAPVQNHNLSFSGGDKNTSYFFSLGYFNQQGVVKYSGMERYNARLNLENRQAERYAVGINVNTSYIYDDYVSNGVGINENAGAIYAAINYDPTVSVLDEDGNYTLSDFITTDNPVALAIGEDAFGQTYRTFGTVYGEYFFVPSLSAKVNIGGDVSNSRRDVFIDPITIEGRAQDGIATIISGTSSNYLVEGTLNFNKKFGDNHKVNAVAGVTTQNFISENYSARASGFIVPTIRTYGLGSGDVEQNRVGSGRGTNKLLSYLGRVNYSLRNKYLLTASFRADGSARFGPNNRFGYFPSMAAAWKIAEEDFFSRIGFLSDLKARVSYGVTGNQSIPNFAYLTTFNNGRDVIMDDRRQTSLQPSRNANPDLKWESTAQFDAGIDFGFLEGRINGSLDYYHSTTTNLLLALPTPLSSGYGTRLSNVGSMKNYGLEFQIDSRNLVGEFKWNTGFNISTNNNEVISLGPIEEIITGGLGFTNDVSITRPGDPLRAYYGYEVMGVWQEDDDFSVTKDNVAPGDLKFRDINGDSTLTAEDRTIIGKPFPDFSWGLTNSFSYKGFELSVFIEGVHGVSMLNNNLVDMYYPINFRRNKLADVYLNRWTPDNPTNEYPSFVNPTAQGKREVNTRTVEDASYIRLQTLRLSYNVPVQNVGFMRNVSVYVTGQNLLTITDYKGVDPSANANGGAVLRIDYNSYPFARTFLAGVNIGF
jgi:TonB-linked SusC/RagA family outer membrane protein